MKPVTPQYECDEEGRVEAIRSQAKLNGIEYLEVASDDQMSLRVAFVLPLPGSGVAGAAPAGGAKLTAANVRIDGGVRIRNIRVVDAQTSGNDLIVVTSAAGDFSTYTLSIVTSDISDDVPNGFDPRLATIRFSFKAGCRSEFDCENKDRCPPEDLTEPAINYRAKDYASFRRLMLDRMSMLMPGWRDRSPADPLVTIVEALALTADHLSYWQDAVATEAYLGTARRRVSVRRHARMLDYPMHEGCNARTWVHFTIGHGAGTKKLPAKTLVLTRGREESVTLDKVQLKQALADGATVFATMHDVALQPEQNEIQLYTWSDTKCVLPRGATRATLSNDPPALIKAGDWLLFEEVVGPKTGVSADADVNHRQVVRLTAADATVDPLNKAPILEIRWDEADALRFPLCLHTAGKPVSVARGNLVLADHGFELSKERVEFERVALDRPPRAALSQPDLTFAIPFDAENFADEASELNLPIEQRVLRSFLTASAAQATSPSEAQPSVTLVSGIEDWQWRFDLLSSDRFSKEFVVEMENNGTASLRFGDDIHGRRPNADESFFATYRVGNGKAGNVGADTLARVFVAMDSIESVRNPLPALGGVDPESMERVRQFAPQAFRRQERAVTTKDWADVAQRDPSVQRAVAQYRWTGSWHTAFVAVDRRGGAGVREDPRFFQQFESQMERYRLAGYDLEINGPVLVSLDIEIHLCVEPGYFRSDVKEAVLEQFDALVHRDGSRGFFHPDRFTFGQPVYLSRIYEAATNVPGVQSVRVVRFQRYGKLPATEIADGFIAMSSFEVARCDNDPSFPESGRFEVQAEGGL